MSALFIGINGKVVAVDRTTGEEIWRAKLGGDFVNLTIDGGELFAATQGELYCLDPVTGSVRWHNPLKGLGYGIVTFATAGNVQAIMRKKRDEEDAAASGATAATMG